AGEAGVEADADQVEERQPVGEGRRRLLGTVHESTLSFPRRAWERSLRRSASRTTYPRGRPGCDAERRGVPFPRGAWERGHRAPLMPPSLRTRQKWTAISTATASGMATQCST